MLAKDRDRIVYQTKDGRWANKRNGASRPASTHATQTDAKQKAKEILGNQGGGELTVKGRDGKIRSKNTIPPGNDPHPPKG